jgi:NADPH:quinone reductase-like Zn-dependent oxidoreductase
MHAIRIHRYGTPDVMELEDIPTPEPGSGQILVKVEAASVNYADLMRRSNTPYPFPTPLPFTPGSEVAGEVAALGSDVAGPPVGTQVFALVGRDGSSGYAQYALAEATQVIPIPPTLRANEACALVVAGATALLVLREVARLQPGEKVLIPGAGGGVGGYAVQLARLLGAGQIVAAASSASKRAAATALGADHVVDYTSAGWFEQVREVTGGHGVDVALEMSGDPLFAQTLACLAPFGRVVVYGMAARTPLRLNDEQTLRFFYAPALNQSLLVFNLGLWFGLRPEATIAALGDLIGFAATGQVKVQIGHVLPLAQATEAHRLIEARQTTGKVILRPWDN